MFQSLLVSLLALFGFAPATSHPARVGPGPTGRRHAVLPAPKVTSATATGPGPGGRRHAIHRTPSPRVAQPVVQPVAQATRLVVQPGAARETAHQMGVRTTGLVRKIPAGRAVRYLQHEACCAPSDVGLPGVTRAEVELALGPDLHSYVALCLRERQPLPSISPALEHQNDAVYRVRLRRAMLDDVELWESTAIARDRQRAEAQEAGIAPPDALRIPAEVEAVIARKAAAAAALLKRRSESAGGATGKGGANVVRLPSAEVAKAEEAPSVPAGPK